MSRIGSGNLEVQIISPKPLRFFQEMKSLKDPDSFFILPYNGQPDDRAIVFHDPMMFFMNRRQGSPTGISNNAKPQVTNRGKAAAIIFDSVRVCVGVWGYVTFIVVSKTILQKSPFYVF